MGNVSAAVAEGARRATGATAAMFVAMEHPSPVSIIPPRGGNAILEIIFADFCLPNGARPYTLAGVRLPRLRCRRR